MDPEADIDRRRRADYICQNCFERTLFLADISSSVMQRLVPIQRNLGNFDTHALEKAGNLFAEEIPICRNRSRVLYTTLFRQQHQTLGKPFNLSDGRQGLTSEPLNR